MKLYIPQAPDVALPRRTWLRNRALRLVAALAASGTLLLAALFTGREFDPQQANWQRVPTHNYTAQLRPLLSYLEAHPDPLLAPVAERLLRAPPAGVAEARDKYAAALSRFIR